MDILQFKGNITPTEGKIVHEYAPFKNLYNEQGELSDFTTKELKFSLNHPVDIKPHFSYDGSVDLILNDNNNVPRLINSRFKVCQQNTYEIPFHLNENPTNVYHEKTFFLNTTLQKQYQKIPRIEFKELMTDGSLPVGNYSFYIKYSDSDGNTTDVIAESSIISCFIGYDRQPKTIQGGYRNQNSNKAIQLKFVNLDTQYNYIQLYYSRDTGDIDQNRTSEIYKINDLYRYTGDKLVVRISGIEDKSLITETELNLPTQVIQQAKTQAICQNRLFLGNIIQHSDDVRELTDIALRFCPYIRKQNSNDVIGSISEKYQVSGSINSGEYYNSKNIYSRIGYWNEEIYRLGIIFIYESGKMSNVYNIRGINVAPSFEVCKSTYKEYQFYDTSINNKRKYISYDFITGEIDNEENARGVIRINDSDNTVNSIYSIGFYNKHYDDCVKELKKLGIMGFFFVRQKRIPTILAQAVLLPESATGDENNNIRIPLLPIQDQNSTDKYAVERFLNDRGTLTHNYQERLYYVSKDSEYYSAICPEYDLHQSKYEQLFTGAQLPIKKVATGNFNNERRHYYLTQVTSVNGNFDETTKILGMPDNTPARGIDHIGFKGIAGSDKESFRTGTVGFKPEISFKKWDVLDVDDNTVRTLNKGNTNLIRGIFGPHIILSGFENTKPFVGDTINIYIPNYDIDDMKDYFQIRYDDNSPYYAINDRRSIDEYSSNNGIIEIPNEDVSNTENIPLDCYRGDCFICNYTVRINRNFQDSSDPINDIIVDELTWRKYYNTDPKHIDVLKNINSSDVNAVKIGSWITIKVKCSRNISMRTEDKSYANEKSLTGSYRTFYPISGFNVSGNTKIPESTILNDGYGSTVGHLRFVKVNNEIYNNNYFKNRIVYSHVNADDENIKSLRIFPISNYRDYHVEFGSITKLIELNSDLIVIFEHGIMRLPVNEKIQTAGDSLEKVFLNSKDVLPKEGVVLSSVLGSQWKDSIIKTTKGHIYGVDTTQKKIWGIANGQLSIISDLIIGEFLNNNIPLAEHQFEEIIGLQNVKTHYNSFKNDVMFTFYVPDIINNKHEKVWNLCWNDTQQTFVTFYSWVPLESNNINNEFYSFDRMGTRDYLYSLGIRDFKTFTAFDEGLLEKPEKETELNNKIYKHGFGGIINGAGIIKPCMWYDKQHPFEFEVIVNDKEQSQKVFNNLRIISNNVEPESFHYEIIGDDYDFNEDKANMYYRQEAKRELYGKLGSDNVYDDKYTDIVPKRNNKSYDCPLYYMKLDLGEKIENDYLVLVTNNGSYDYSELSGTELVRYEKLDEIRLQEHVKAVDINKSGRLRGNMQYLGNYWNVQINPILITQKNESWDEIPPLTLFNNKIPNNISTFDIKSKDLPEKYQNMKLTNAVDMTSWGTRSEIKLKDKWVKIRIRYSGKQLALISALQTMYSISYS